MASRDQVIEQMQSGGLPPLPAGHPICDGKQRRYGPKKKAWYKFNQITTKAGKELVYGVYGYWRGTDNGAIGVSLDSDEVSQEEMAAARQKQDDAAKAELEKQERLAAFAAGRARMQWDAALAADPDGSNVSSYLTRKRVAPESVRVTTDGTLLVPVKRYSLADGIRLVGLQKIAPDGSKLFNKGMQKVGGAFLLGILNQDTPLIALAEGYATGGSARMSTDQAMPVMLAFDAGNLLSVAQVVRHDFPNVHILFLADDDWQLERRLAERLQEDFNLQVAVAADGLEHALIAEDGSPVKVTAAWHKDECGVPYLEADVRSGRQIRTLKFENAGIAKSTAAAKAVGNASVVWPKFADRGDHKWTDFNDLHVEQSLDAVAEQIRVAIDAALTKPPPDLAPSESPAPLEGASASAVEPSAVQPDLPGGAPPPPLSEWAASQVAAISKPTIDSLLEHFSLVYGSTDVWDGLNRQRIKKAAFFAAVGKEIAQQWLGHEKRRTITGDSLPILKRGRAVEAGAGGGRLDEMLQRLTLLYGTVTVWDSDKRVVMSLDAVRAAYSGDMVKRWQEHALRRMIDAENLVFDPTQRVDPDTHINMFHGFPLVPVQDDEKVLPVLELLFDLCSQEENSKEVGDWLLKWLAYPLQHPGAKMQTAVLMFGEKQGTGKSLFFEGIMRPIYGEYSGTAGQHQLDSAFTDWKSRKIFMVFEEVLSRDERYSHIGTLKHMITGRDMRINPKNLPERVESNHLNSAFLSNESQPIPIELEDRRWLVIEARNKLSDEFLLKVKQLMKDGLSAAFYHFLLHYPLGDFDEHTKPIMTEAKRKIIRFGRPSWDAFHEAWKEGELPAPYCSCLSEDLYKVYSQWCERNHEKRLSLTKFAELVAARELKTKKWVTLGSQSKKSKMVFLIGAGDGSDLNKDCQKFRDLADIKVDL